MQLQAWIPGRDHLALMVDADQPDELHVRVRDQLCRRVIVVATAWGESPDKPICTWSDEERCRPTLKAIFKTRHRLIHRYLRWRAEQYQAARTLRGTDAR